MNPLTKRKFSDSYYKIRSVVEKFPIYDKGNVDRFGEMLDRNDVVIIESTTGSGKSVGCPIVALKKYNYNAKIILTQPRVVNIKSAADFISAQLDVELGTYVGFLHGGDKKYNLRLAKILVCTDSLFYKVMEMMTGNDPVIVFVDEVHERSIYMDLILSYIIRHHVEVKIGDGRLVKFVLLSATIDVEFYKKFFRRYDILADALTVGGKRKFNITHKYLEFTTKNIKSKIDKAVEYIVDNYLLSQSDILFFLPTTSLCHYGVKRFEALNDGSADRAKILVDVLSRATNQNIKDLLTGVKKYDKLGFHQRIIFSTPISETGITFESVGGRNIDIVVDFGYKNIVKFNPRTGFFDQMIGPISRSSVIQRCGRVGRISDGICYHIYSHNEYKRMRKYISPQINESNYYNLIIIFLKLRGDLYDVMIDIKFLPTPIHSDHLNFALLNLYMMGILRDMKFSVKGAIATDLGISEELGILIMNSFKYYDIIKYIVPIAIFININSNPRDWISLSDNGKIRNSYGVPISFLILWLEFKKSRAYRSSKTNVKIRLDYLREWCGQKNYNYELFSKMVISLQKTDERLQKYERQISDHFILKLKDHATKKKLGDSTGPVDDGVSPTIINKIILVFSTTFSDIRLYREESNNKFRVYNYRGDKTKMTVKPRFITPVIDFENAKIIGCKDVIVTESGFPIIVCPFIIKKNTLI